MSARNALLCWLLGEATEAGPAVLSDPATLTLTGEAGLVAAMGLARSGQIDRFAVLVDGLDPGYAAPLSRYGLFLGLGGDHDTAFLVFDVLKRRHPACAAVWIDLAVLQAACDYPAAALRSMAMHRALTGRDGDAMVLPSIAPETATSPGAIRFLAGDATSFSRA